MQRRRYIDTGRDGGWKHLCGGSYISGSGMYGTLGEGQEIGRSTGAVTWEEWRKCSMSGYCMARMLTPAPVSALRSQTCSLRGAESETRNTVSHPFLDPSVDPSVAPTPLEYGEGRRYAPESEDECC
eukprot:6847107-Pyramimonas_sp.AAC.2